MPVQRPYTLTILPNQCSVNTNVVCGSYGAIAHSFNRSISRRQVFVMVLMSLSMPFLAGTHMTVAIDRSILVADINPLSVSLVANNNILVAKLAAPYDLYLPWRAFTTALASGISHWSLNVD